jgi:hypothetical protein
VPTGSAVSVQRDRLARANRLLGGFSSTVMLFIAYALHLVAFNRTNAAADKALEASFPRPIADFAPFELVRGAETWRFRIQRRKMCLP